MAIDPRLENYLATLEKALSPIPVSDRADIITEIKSHVLVALEKDPSSSLDTVLSALGEAETVANRYLLERGLKPGKPPISPVVKWIVIGFLGTIALIVAGLLTVLVYFSPVLEINSQEDRLVLLGGLVKIEGDGGDFGSKGNGKASYQSEKSFTKGEKIGIRFSNAKIGLGNSGDGKLHWSCKRFKGSIPSTLEQTELGQTLDLSGAAFLKCEIEVPEGIELSVSGSNGKLDVEKPHFSLAARISNGQVEVIRDPSVKYAFDAHVANGKVGAPESDPDPDYRVEINLANGAIEVE